MKCHTLTPPGSDFAGIIAKLQADTHEERRDRARVIGMARKIRLSQRLVHVAALRMEHTLEGIMERFDVPEAISREFVSRAVPEMVARMFEVQDEE